MLSHAHLGHAAQAAADTDRLLDLADPERFPVERFMGTYNAGMIAYLAGDLLAPWKRCTAPTPWRWRCRVPGRLDHATVLLDAGLAADAIRGGGQCRHRGGGHDQRLFVAQLHTLAQPAFSPARPPHDAYAAASAALLSCLSGQGRLSPGQPN